MCKDGFKFEAGGVVTEESESYISRDKKLEDLTDGILKKIIKGKQVSYSIEGINRIGKTSLMRELCRRFAEEGHPNILVILTSLSETEVSSNSSGFWEFWRGQVLERIFDELNGINLEIIKRKNEERYSEILEIKDYFNDTEKMDALFEGGKKYAHVIAKGKLINLFQHLVYCEQYILLVIDEFDRAREVFSGDKNFFNWLRGLLNGEKNALSIVTISRRSLSCIETGTYKGSALHGIFEHCELFGYTNQELDKYFNLLKEHGCELSDDQKADVIYYCGRSPYYLAHMGNSILQWKRKGLPLQDMKISLLFTQKQNTYYESFERVVQILREENLYWPMLQLFVGPQYDLDEDKIGKLIGYGYCMRKSQLCSDENDDYKDVYHTYEEEYNYLTICNSFIDYLAMQKEQDADTIFPQLSKVEKSLRSMVRQHLQEKFNEQWKDKVRDILFNGLLQRDKKRQAKLEQDHKRYLSQREGADNPAGTDDSILNVISIFELGAVIEEEWEKDDYYKDKLPSSMHLADFKKGISLMNKVRNPVAHGNGEIVPSEEIQKVKAFCKELENI